MIPVTILTGFLGAGKTTLLNRILTGDHGKRIAVVVNEFGEIGLDDRFIARAKDDIVELTNGCVCCAAKNDTVQVLTSLVTRLRNGETFDQVIIETTGLAKPASLCRFFLGDSPLKQYYRLDGIATVVDAYHAFSQLVHWPEVKEQVAIADVIIVNKTDLVEPVQLERLEEWLRGVNETASFVRAQRAEVPIASILNIGGFDLIGKETILRDDDHEHIHDAYITSVSIREDRPLDRGKFLAWLNELVAMEGGHLLRYKGILSFKGAANRTILQGVHMMNELTDGGPWGDTSPTTELVIIGRRLEEYVLRQGFLGCVAR